MMKTAMEYFEEISRIPRVSGDEKAVADYLEAFAGEHGLPCRRDALHNVVITKSAFPGYETAETVMLQGHTDMVGAKHEGVVHDFSRDPICLRREGDVLRAAGTTLGADDGVAVAYMLYILAAPGLRHPRLECVFTVQEETGLIGATALDVSGLRAKYLLNLDAGPEGVLLASCAGGQRLRLRRNMENEPVHGSVWELAVSGLLSGHSGAVIQMERANALVLTGLILDRLRGEGAQLISLSGGVKDNVLPASAKAVFAMETSPEETTERVAAEIKRAYAFSDPDIEIAISPARAEKMLARRDSDAVLDLLQQLPHGVVSLSAAMPGLVETSANLAVAEIGEMELHLQISLRSSESLRTEQLTRRIELCCAAYGVEVKIESAYPGWAYAPASPLRDRCVRVYEKLYGKKPSVEGIHAGLECGLLLSKMPELDIVAMGPTYKEMHTPDEWLSVSSFERFLEYLTALLADMG